MSAIGIPQITAIMGMCVAGERSPIAGALTTPRTPTPSIWSAISVAQAWIPRAKFAVESIGSMIHRRPTGSWEPPSSSPRIESPGNAAAIASRAMRSTEVSAWVTKLVSALRRISSSSLRKNPCAVSAARSASSFANATSRSYTGAAYLGLATVVTWDLR